MDTLFDRFKNTTGCDIELFFNDYVDFVDNYYNNIVNYYSNGAELNKDVINKLNDLTSFANQINGVLNSGTNWSNYYEDWQLLDYFTDVYCEIMTINNSQKWFRANKGLTFDNKTEKDYILKQNQTLESLANDLGYTLPNNDWVDVALRNKVTEEDYTVNGGNILKVVFQNNGDYKLSSVLDSISGENLYGIDIQKKYEFSDNDIKVLEYRDTLSQTIETLVNLTKGSVNEFLQDGIDKSVIGSNINSIRYPSIFRQMSDVFAKDDCFKSFSISNIGREKDGIFIEFSIQTRIGEVLTENLRMG